MDGGKVLVNYDPSDNLKLQYNGLNVIEQIPNDFGIIVIAAVGPGRCGKSSLLNQLIRKDSFAVGSSTRRVTKGIWVDSCLDNTNKIATIYLDVEGFGDPEREDAGANDTRLMLIVSQMCDVVIYNTRGVYDYNLTAKLELVCHMFKRYRKHHQVFSSPILIVCHRDFDFFTPEHPDVELRDQLRHVHDSCFRSMKAFFFERPTNVQNLRNLSKMTDSELDNNYIQSRQRLEKYIQMKAKPLCTHSGKQITATVFVEAIRTIINAVVEDNLEGISASLIGLLRKQNDVIVKEAVQEYEEQIKENWPTDTTAEFLHKRLQRSMKAKLETKLYDVEGRLSTCLFQFKQKTKQAFLKESETKAKEKLETLNATIELKYTKGYYFVIGGSFQFKADMDCLEETYNQYVNLGPKANIVLQEYKENQLSKAQMIQARENVLSHEQVRTEREALVIEINQVIEERNLLIRRQENMQTQRNGMLADLVKDIAIRAVEVGLMFLFHRWTR